MMGRQSRTQDKLFYAFNLEDHIPANHLLRGVNEFLDLGDLHEHLADFYSQTGRPSIDPELMIRMLIIGYCFGIRSERRLCEEVHLNLAYRWFCQLDLEDKIPDHSTFSKNRHGRFRDSETFRHVFETVLRRCMSEGLVGGEGFAVDASIIKADANRAAAISPGTIKDWSQADGPSRAVREYLEALKLENPTDEASVGAAATRTLSLTDPASRYTAAPGGPAFFAYSTNYLIDTQNAVILDVAATATNRTAEVESTKTMINRVEERFDLVPKRLIADMAYGAAPMLAWLVQNKGIEPHVPVWDKTRRNDGTFSSNDFQWHEQVNEYRCPAGQALKSHLRLFKKVRPLNPDKDSIKFRASRSSCGACPMKPSCCPNMPSREITRSIHESSRDVARQIAKTDAYQRSRKERKKVEMLFAHLKRILKLDRLRLRGLRGAEDEFLMAATAQNLRKMVKKLIPVGGRTDFVIA